MCLISDYLLTRSVYIKALQQIEEIEFVFDFGSFKDCTNFLERRMVDAILIDVRLNHSELESIKELQSKYNKTKFIVLAEQDELLQVMAIGAAYILKDMTLDEFISIVETILKGNLFIAARAVDILKEILQEKLHINEELSKFNLTERELEILELIAKGNSNPQIGDKLCLSQFTVKNYVSRIIEKLEVKTRTEATAKAIHLGLVQN